MIILLEIAIKIGFILLACTFFIAAYVYRTKSAYAYRTESKSLFYSALFLGFLSLVPVLGGWYGIIPGLILLLLSLFGFFSSTKEAKVTSIIVITLVVLNLVSTLLLY